MTPPQPAEAYIIPNAGPLAVAKSSTGGPGDDTAIDVAEAAEDAPVAATAAVAAKPATTETQFGAKQQLLAACQAAEHWLQAERDRPGETRPDEICASCAPPSSGPKASGSLESRASHVGRASRVNPGKVRVRAPRRQW